MATSNRLVSIGLIVLLCWFAAGCSSSGPKPATSLLFTSPMSAPIIELASVPQSVTLTVNQPASFSLQSGTGCALAQGTLSTAQGSSTTYTAPAVSATNCSGPLRVSVVATSAADPTVTAVMVVDSLVFFSSCPPSGTLIPPLDAIAANTAVAQQGTFYSQTIGDQGYNSIPPTPGGVAPFTWAITAGSLPAGLSLSPGADSSSVVISGKPTAPGCSAATTFTLQVTDATGVASPPVTYTLVVIPQSLKVQSPTLPSAYNLSGDSNGAGVPYSPATFVASNGVAPYTWTQFNPTNNAPLPGLNVSQPAAGSNLAMVYGTPAAGSAGPLGTPYTNQLQVSDSQSPYPAMFITNQITTNNLILPQFCAPANGGVIFPNSTNGGTVGGNSVLTDSYMQGSFAFLLRGFDVNGGPIVMAGSATLDGAGNVTGGEEDVTTGAGHKALTIEPGSVYVVGTISPGLGSPATAYQRGCMALSLKDSMGTVTTTNFAFTLGGCSNHYIESQAISTADNACGMTQSAGQNVAAGQFTLGLIIEFDCTPGTTCAAPGGARASGILRLQDPSSLSAGLSGPYAFGLSGQDAAGGRYAVAGSFKASSGNLTAVAADTNDAGTLGTQLTGGSGSYASSDSNGRITGSVSVGSSSFDWAAYIVSKNEALLITTDTLAVNHPILGGEAITTVSSFNAASLENTHMFHLAGVTSGAADVSIGVLTFDGISALTGTEYEDQGGTLGTAQLSGVYNVDSATGRAAFLAPQQGQSLGAHPFVAYLIPAPSTLTRASCSVPANCVTGFLVGTDASTEDGVLEFQTPTIAPPPPFNTQFVTGDYVFGTDEPLDPGTSSVEGTAYAGVSASSSTTGTLGPTGIAGSHPILQDVTFGDPNYCLQSGCYLLLPSESLTGSYSVNTNGTGTFGNGKASVTNGNVIFYIDESSTSLRQGSVVVDPHPSIVVAEQ